MPQIGPYFYVLIAGNELVVSADNFRQLYQAFPGALDYIEEIGISADYWAITLQQGAPRRTANPLAARQGITVGQTSARRSAHRRRWRSASPATRERLLRYGRYQGASPSEIRRYYESGRTLERLRPTPQRLLDDPTRWKPYIETHRHTIDRRMGQGTAAGLLAMTQSQKSGRYGAGYGVYVQAGEKRR